MYLNVIKHPLCLMKNVKFAWDFCVDSPMKIALLSMGVRRKQSGSVAGRRIYSRSDANRIIRDALAGNAPVLIGRNGGTETRFIAMAELKQIGAIDQIPQDFLKNGKDKSGIFPSTENLAIRFAKEYQDSIGEEDVTTYWGHIPGEKYVLSRYSPNAKLIPSISLEPFGIDDPWTMALEGKRVLVVHPFADEITAQYKNREKLFKDQRILPSFDLITVKAVQTLADADCPYQDWFEALDYMSDMIQTIDFDIAILGCGAYAIPLGARIKRSGKKAIVLGGMTQLLFGIKGARWEKSRPDIVNLYNEYWIRSGNKPKGSERTEENAYW